MGGSISSHSRNGQPRTQDEREQRLGTRHVAHLWTLVLDSFLSGGNQAKV